MSPFGSRGVAYLSFVSSAELHVPTVPTVRYLAGMFDDDDDNEHANTYLHIYLHLLRYMCLLAQLRELLPIPVDCNSLRPELYKSKTYLRYGNKQLLRTQLPYLTLLS